MLEFYDVCEDVGVVCFVVVCLVMMYPVLMCLPNMVTMPGMYLTDITFMEDGNGDYLGTDVCGRHTNNGPLILFRDLYRKYARRTAH